MKERDILTSCILLMSIMELTVNVNPFNSQRCLKHIQLLLVALHMQFSLMILYFSWKTTINQSINQSSLFPDQHVQK